MVRYWLSVAEAEVFILEPASEVVLAEDIGNVVENVEIAVLQIILVGEKLVARGDDIVVA